MTSELSQGCNLPLPQAKHNLQRKGAYGKSMNKLLHLIAGILLASQATAVVDQKAVLDHYADMAQVKYEDALTTARTPQQAVDKLIAEPTEDKRLRIPGIPNSRISSSGRTRTCWSTTWETSWRTGVRKGSPTGASGAPRPCGESV